MTRRDVIVCDLCTSEVAEGVVEIARVEILCRPDELRDGHWEFDACSCCRAGLHQVISLTIRDLSSGRRKPATRAPARRRRKR